MTDLTFVEYMRDMITTDNKTREKDEYFPGRRPDQCQFKPGDIVEYVFNDTVTLGIVMECQLQSHLSVTSPLEMEQ